MVMQLRFEKIFVWRGCIKNLCFSIHMTISTLLSYPCTIPETIVSPLWLFLALLYFHTLCAFLFNLSFSSRFLKFPSLTPLTPHLHLPLSSSLLTPHPLQPTLWPPHHLLWVFHFPMTEPVTSLLSPALRTCAVKGIFVPQGPSSPREVCAVLFIQKKGFGLTGIFGANGKIWASLGCNSLFDISKTACCVTGKQQK